MIRYAYINQQILKTYLSLNSITFPINLKNIIENITSCRYLSYQQFSQRYHCSIDDVIKLCESEFGCSFYYAPTDHYLILCNESTENNNTPERQRWTLAHELGHIICNHHRISIANRDSESHSSKIASSEYESEADYFAAMLLSPFPLFKLLNITSVADTRNTFDLSNEASRIRYEQYLKWCRTKFKTAWENDMIRVYKEKGCVS